MLKRIFALFLAMVMLFGSLPTSAFATEENGDGVIVTEATQPVETQPPATQPTEAPAATTEATSAPTTEATETPATEETSAPTTEETSAPTTEAPTESTTEATGEPTTEATSEPTTEVTTESTTEATTESTTEETSEETTQETSTETTQEELPPSEVIDSWISVGTHTLHINAAEGVFPGGTAVCADLHQSFEIGDILSSTVSNLELFAAFDIQAVGEDGTALQPDGTVYVDIYSPDSLGGMEGATVRVYHVDIDQGTATEISCLVDIADAVVSFATTCFGTYAITVSDLPQCICENQCTEETANDQCPVCSRDVTACWGAPAVLSIEELAALFAALPDCSTITFETTEEEKTAIFAQLEEAMNAYYALMDADFDTCSLFEQQYEDLIRNAQLLNDALTGNNWISYATTYNVPYNPNGQQNTTITLSGNSLSDVAPQVVRFDGDTVYVYEVVKLTNGSKRYAFTRNNTSDDAKYIITAATSGASLQRTMSGGTSSFTFRDGISTGYNASTREFKLFYIYSHSIPAPYHGGSTDNADYGPSGTGKEMVRVTVNLNTLKNNPNVVLGTNDSISWYFVPKFDAYGNVSQDKAELFWNAVLDNMNASSKTALANTGMLDQFIGYMIKHQSDYYHGDGILNASYAAELHEEKSGRTEYFGTVAGDDKRYVDVLALCDQNLGGTVYWDTIDPTGSSVGYFYETVNNTERVIKVTVTQFDLGSNHVSPDGSDIRYTEQGDGRYFLAKYKMKTAVVSTTTTVSVTYTDGGAGVFSDVTYPYVLQVSNMPTFGGSTAREGYTFTGWKYSVDGKIYKNNEISTLEVPQNTASVTLTAQWDPNLYTVIWKDSDGTVLETDVEVPYNAVPTFDKYQGRPLPDKNGVGYTEVFSGWTPDITRTTGDPSVAIVYIAAYTQIPHQYNVVWKNYDGTILETDEDVNYGTTPTYDGAEPEKPEDAQFTYQFSGWSPAVEPVTNYTEYTAQFAATVRTYTVRWLDEDGKVLETDLNVPYGSTPSYDQTPPTKAETAEFTYTFKGWTPSISAVSGDATYRAEYTAHRRSYTVQWKNADGTLLGEDTVEYGQIPVYSGQLPTKDADAQYTYTFDKWSPELKAVTGNAEYTATFHEILNKYTVTWNFQSFQLQEIDLDVGYGTALSFDNWDKLHYQSASYIYTFTGWKLEGDNTDTLYKTAEDIAKLTVSGDMTLNAQYTAEKKGYDITVRVIVDPVLEDGNFVSGQQMTLKDVMGQEPGMYLKNQEGASYELKQESGSKDYLARLVPNGEYSLYMGEDSTTPYSPYTLVVQDMDRDRNLYFYSVTYDPDGGTMNGSTLSYHRGSVTVTNTVPVKAGHNFLGWQVDDTNQILKAGDTLDADIQKPHTLKALWGNVRVDVQVTVKHGIYKTDGTLQGTDQHPGELKVKLAYRTAGNTAEDYVEVVGAQTQSYNGPYKNQAEDGTTTVVTFEDVFVGLDGRYDYSANALLNHYSVVSRKTVKAEADNHYIVQIELQYNPDMFNLEYEVEADSAMPEQWIPSAVDVKLVYLHEGHWDTIAAHDHNSVDVEINQTRNNEAYARFGTGSYPVPVSFDGGETRYYRIAAVGFTVGEGSNAVEMTASGKTEQDGWVFSSAAAPGKYSAGAYTATLSFTTANQENENHDNHQGAHGILSGNDYVQHGDLKLLVKAHPATVQLNVNYEAANPAVYETIEDVFVVPDLTAYVPTRPGYTFAGWYHDAQCTEEAVAGNYLKLGNNEENVLYAKWNADITVEGTVAVANSYTEGQAVHELHDANLIYNVTVQVLNAQGLQVKSQSITINYPVNAQNEVNGFGTASFKIEGIPNDGNKYYVNILQSNASYYTALYQNEVDPNANVDNLSLNAAGDYSRYYANRNRVAKGTTNPEIATVNAFLQFKPVNFNLYYTIDADAIGPDFRPDLAHVAIFGDLNAGEGFDWKVIAQMLDGDVVTGKETPITENMAPVSFPVWQSYGDGTPYNYAVGPDKIRYYPDGDAVPVIAEAGTNHAMPDTLPFAVSYDPGYTFYDAHGSYETQYRLLKIVLTPKEYPVNYVTNGGTMPETYPTKHKWSVVTNLKDVEPQRNGYSFAGWYTDAALTNKVTALEAKVRTATTLYAKWTADDFEIRYNLQNGTDPGNPTSYNIETATFALQHPTREGYTFEGWTGTGLADITKDVVVSRGSTGDRAYTAHWEQNRYKITVTVENGSSTPAGDLTVLYGNDQTIRFAPKSASYALDTVEVDGSIVKLAEDGSYTFTDVNANHSIHVVYSEDSNSDTIPDTRQARVTYEVQNGTFAAGPNTSADGKYRLYIIDLEQKNDKGEWVPISPAPTLGNTQKYGDTIPKMQAGDMEPIAGYHNHGHWREDPLPGTQVVNGAHYLFHFDERITHFIQYYPTGQMVNPQYTSGIYYGTNILIKPNGGLWTFTWENDTTVTYADDHPFQLTQNMYLGSAQREHYVFDGWTHSTQQDGADHVYTAKWVPEQYTITYHMPYGFLDGTNPSVYTVESDTITLKNPTRDGYTFLGWKDADTGEVSTNVVIPKGSFGDREFTAMWQAKQDTPYTVRYYFEVLNSGTGETVYAEDAALKAAETLYGETDTEVTLAEGKRPEKIGNFLINEELSVITGKIAGSGQLELSVYYDREVYKVTWVSEDETLETDTVKYGEKPSYDGIIPAKAGTNPAQFSYTFTGWDKDITQPIVAETVFTAQYQESVNEYTITWMNEDAVLDTDTVPYGETPVYSGETPTKASSAQHYYTFKIWTPTIAPVTGNQTYTATYETHDRLYTATVQFKVDDSAASHADMANSLNGQSLYLGSMDAEPEYTMLEAVADADGLYKAMVVQGNYQVYIGTETSKKLISDDIIVSIFNTAGSAEVNYYTVRYYAGYGEGGQGALLKTSYLLKGTHADVDLDNPNRTPEGEWYFKGWKKGTNTTLYQHKDHLSDAIAEPMVLVGQWSNVKVNLTVTIVHGAEDDYTTRNLEVHLAYANKTGSEDYVEVVGSGEQVPFTRQQNTGTTTVTYTGYTGLSDDYKYSNTVALHNYVITARTAEYIAQSNTYDVAITLQYNPDVFQLKYSVDATAIVTNADTGWLVPEAVDVKVLHYADHTEDNIDNITWHPISIMEHVTREVALDATTKTGSGSYEVPRTSSDNVLVQYWVDAVGLTVLDANGNEIEMTTSSTGSWTWESNAVPGKYPEGAYTIESEIKPSATGASYVAPDGQSQAIQLNVQVHPATVILKPGFAGGEEKTISNIFTLPNLAQYIPTRAEHTFQGWKLEGEDNLATMETGDVLDADTTYTLVAQWKQNLTISGTITANNYYNGEQLDLNDRIGSATVYLYRDDSLRSQVGTPIAVTLTPVTTEDNQRSDQYEFANIPNDGSDYYIVVSAPGCAVTYERISEDQNSALDENYAVFPNNAVTARIDASLEFDPEDFDLAYEVDVSELGKDFWPVGTSVLVMAHSDVVEDYEWYTIIQMNDGGEPIAINSSTGVGADTYPVWRYHPSGYPYNYAIRLEYLPLDINGDGVIDARRENLTEGIDGRPNNLPIEVNYKFPAYYKAIEPHQSQLLRAVVSPKTSTITLDPAGGTLTLLNDQNEVISGNTVEHEWSYSTVQKLNITHEGYYFQGWADENGHLVSDTLAVNDQNKAMLAADGESLSVGAAWYGDVKLTAVWTKIQTVNFFGGDRIITYNGQEQTVEFVVGSDLPEDYSFEGLSCTATGKNVSDEWNIVFTEAVGGIRIFDENDVDVTHLYAVGAKTPGSLTVEKAVLTVSATNQSKTYDGTPFGTEAAETWDYAISGLLGQDTEAVVGGTVSYAGSAKDAVTPGTYTITPAVTALTADNYVFVPEDGTLTIGKAPITATLDVVNKVYDGTNVVKEYTVETEGRIGTDRVEIQVETIAFPNENVGKHTVKAENLSLVGEHADYYYLDIQKIEDQDAQITPKTLTVWLSPVSRKYDGTTKVEITFRTVTGLLTEDQVSVVNIPATGTLKGTKDAGTGKAVEVAHAPQLSGVDAGNYTIAYEVDTVDILPRTVILATESSIKFFDGEPLTASGYSIGGDGFVANEVSNFRTTGSVVGSDEAEVTVDNPIVYDEEEGYLKANYDISWFLGKLTVYPDKNDDNIPDTEQQEYTVTYLAEGTNLAKDVVHDKLFVGMDVPAAPEAKAANDNGYSIQSWTLVGTGSPDADGKIADASLIYRAVLVPNEFNVTYELGEGGTNPADNPGTYTYGVGVPSFADPSREGYVFDGWYVNNTPVKGISQEDFGNKTLVAKWLEDENKDHVPDKQQVEIFFAVENGTWQDGTSETRSHIYTVYDENGTALENVTLGAWIPDEMIPATGYDAQSGSWSGDITKNTPVPKISTTYTYTFGERLKYKLTVDVRGGSAKVDGKDYDQPVIISYGEGAQITFTADENLILDTAVMVKDGNTTSIFTDVETGSYAISNVTEDVAISVQYSPDTWHDEDNSLTKGDGIPDTRQAVFQFQVSGTNGSLSGNTTQVVTLQPNASGSYVQNIAPETVTVTPAPTYRLKEWKDANNSVASNPFASRTVQGGSQSVYTAYFHQVYADVQYHDADKLVNNVPQLSEKTLLVDKVIRVDPNGGSWCNSEDVQDITVLQDITLEVPTRTGYIFGGWKCEEPNNLSRSTVQITYQFTAQWLADASGKEDGGGDGIPDIYQKKVIFKVVNGSWAVTGLGGLLSFAGTSEDIVYYLTLTDDAGNYSQNGKAYLAPLVPTGMHAKWGYHNGKWDVTPPDFVSGTGTVTYTYRFEAKNLMNPKTGDDSAIAAWLMAMLSALAVLASMFFYGYRKKRVNRQ